MGQVGIEAAEENQMESARVITAIIKRREAMQKGISVTKQICDQCSAQSLYHLVYKVLLDEVEEALPNIAGLESKLQEIAAQISQEKARVAEEEKQAADAEADYAKRLKARAEEDRKEAEEEAKEEDNEDEEGEGEA